MTDDAPDSGAAGASIVVPDGTLAGSLRTVESLTVIERSTPEAVRERVAVGDIDGVVHGHGPDRGEPFVAAAREAAAGLPVVRVVPDGGPTVPADPDERTAHVREVGDWPAAVADRLGRLVEETPYRELYNATDEGLLLHPGNTPEAVATNDRLHELLGHDTDADLGIEEIISGETAFGRADVAAAVDRALREGEQTFEWLNERRDGERMWVEVTLRPTEIRGAEQVVATIRDIDERKAREQEAAAAEVEADLAESRRESTLSRVSDAFFGLDDDWRFTYVTERAAELIDVDREAVRGERLWEVFPEAKRTQFEYEYRAAMLTQEPVSFEARYPPLEAWFEVNAYPSSDGLSVYFRDVTERKRREAELEAYERLVENVEGALFVLDGAGQFELVTEPLADWLGRDRAAIESEPAAPLLAPDDEDAATALRRTLSEGRATSFEAELIDPPHRRTGVVELSPLPSGAVGSLRDVTAERARQRSHEALIDNVPGMVYRRSVAPATVADGAGRMFDPDAGESVTPRMTFASEAATEVAGREPERLTEGEADWLTDVVHPADRESLVEQLRTAAAEGEPFTARYRVITPSGTKWVRDHGRPVTGPEGRITSVEGFVVDVTARTQRERHRRVMMRVLRHNLRNSVQVISGFAQEIADRAADIDAETELASLAGTIDDRAGELAELSATARDVDDAVAAATEATGQVDAAALGRAVAAERRERHPDATVETALPDSLRVQGDSTLKRAIDALVENAVVHNDGDAAVRLSTVDPDREGWTGLQVADDGPGIPERERAVLDEDTEITQLVHARGLGLWLVKWLVESHGGELRIDTSETGGTGADGGSTVTLLLPRV